MIHVFDLAEQRFPQRELEAILDSRAGHTVVERDLAHDLATARDMLRRMAVALEQRSWRARYSVGNVVYVLLRSGWTRACVVEATRRFTVECSGLERLRLRVLLPSNIMREHEDTAQADPEFDLTYEVGPQQTFEFAQNLDGDFYYSPPGWLGELPFSEPFETIGEGWPLLSGEIDP
jgi:hypothetical protein